MDNLIERLKYFMDAKGYTVYKLTSMTSLSENTVYNWFNKGAVPTIPALEAICRILEISLSELFSDGESDIMTYKEKVLLEKFRNLSENQKDLLLKITEEFGV